jgi:hypothetical protein
MTRAEEVEMGGRGHLVVRRLGGVLAVAIAWPLLAVGATDAQSAPPDGGAVVHETLATRLNADGTGRTELLRSTLWPGTAMPPARFGGDWLVRADEGILTLTLVEGSVVVGEGEGITVRPGMTVNLGEGRVLMAGPDAVMRWENRDDEPVRLLSVATVPDDRPTMVLQPQDRPDISASGPVMRRHVISGTSLSGDRSRITVLDRSGRITGARIPTARELRFAGPGWSSPDGHVTLGPIASIGSRRSEILIRSTSTPCGPVVSVDVAKDLSAITVVDDTPGCDAMGVPYAVVLRVRGPVSDAGDIAVKWERAG